MKAIAKSLKAKEGTEEEYIVYPKTLIKCITDENGSNLEDTLQAFLEEKMSGTYATNETVEDIVDGTTPVAKATDADTVGGKSASELAKAADHAIKTYNSLSSIGLSDDDMSADDFQSNIIAIKNALPTYADIKLGFSSNSGNLLASIITKINADNGTSYDYTAIGCALQMRKLAGHNSGCIIDCIVDNSTGVKRIYTCILDTSGSGTINLSSFTESYNTNGFVPCSIIVSDTEANFNDYTTEGTYYFSTSTTLTNAPDGASSGWLEVTHVAGASTLMQTWQERMDVTKSCIRTKSSSSTWREWSGFLPLTGGKVTGNIEIERNTYPTVTMYNTTTERYSRVQSGDGSTATLANRADSSNETLLWLYPETADLITLLKLGVRKSGVLTSYNVLHTGNKPIGSYTGNGDATARNIDIGGVGSALLVWSINAVALITAGGAMCQYSTTLSALPAASVKFDAGVLSIVCSDTKVNESGTTYYYQVL